MTDSASIRERFAEEEVRSAADFLAARLLILLTLEAEAAGKLAGVLSRDTHDDGSHEWNHLARIKKRADQIGDALHALGLIPTFGTPDKTEPAEPSSPQEGTK